MSSRLAVIIGLIAGAAMAGVLLGALVAFAPQLSEALGVGDPIVPLLSPGGAVPSASVRPPAAGASPAVRGSPAATNQAEPTDAVPSEAPSGSASAPPSAPSPRPGAFHVGEAAPALALPLLGGGTVDLANLRGKPVWVNFMATYCPPCRDEFPVMSGFQARYADSGLVVLAVDVREDTATVQEFVGQTGATFPIALDADGAAQKAWGAAALPVHFWIDAQGVVRDGALGGIGPDLMAQSLGRILPGISVTP